MFPDCLKEANVTPTFKKDDPLYIEIYHPVEILPLLFKGATKLQAKYIFFVCHKNKRKHNQHFELLFFMISFTNHLIIENKFTSHK